MKIKRIPEDFEVEEVPSAEFLAPRQGPYAVYRLTKRGIGTIEAVDAVARKWGIERRRISYGGLKDRHALTRQHLTILHGPRRGFKQENLELEHLGQAPRPFTAKEIAANRFQVVLRDLSPERVATILTAAGEVRREGFPNRFGSQRFGSVGVSGEFIARAWIAGDYEKALRLALAEPREGEHGPEKEEKEILRRHWGAWPACKAALPRGSRRSVVTYLVDHPADFRRAFALIKQDLRSLYLAAFQSHLWNRMLDAFLKGKHPSDASLPLPSARLKLEPGPVKDLIDATLAAEGLTLREIRVKYPRDSFFSKGERAAVVVPKGLTAEEGPDDLHPGRRKLVLRFTLPRGAYATVLIDRLAMRQ